MNKATRTKIEKFTRAQLAELFGPPWGDDTWIIPYGTTGGTVRIWPVFSNHPWLACRLSNPIYVAPDGYIRPRQELNWPGYFTYPSGKFNLHSGPNTTFEDWEREFAIHLYQLTAPGSPERQLVGGITWNS